MNSKKQQTDLQFGAGVEVVSRRPSLQGGEGDVSASERRDIRVLSCAERPGLLGTLPRVAAVRQTVSVSAGGTGNK